MHGPGYAKMTSVRCEECPSRSEDARGWVALIIDDDEEPDVDPYVAFGARCVPSAASSAL